LKNTVTFVTSVGSLTSHPPHNSCCKRKTADYIPFCYLNNCKIIGLNCHSDKFIFTSLHIPDVKTVLQFLIMPPMYVSDTFHYSVTRRLTYKQQELLLHEQLREKCSWWLWHENEKREPHKYPFEAQRHFAVVSPWYVFLHVWNGSVVLTVTSGCPFEDMDSVLLGTAPAAHTKRREFFTHMAKYKLNKYCEREWLIIVNFYMKFNLNPHMEVWIVWYIFLIIHSSPNKSMRHYG